MFTKVHLAFYNMLFELYGKLYRYYKTKGKEDKMKECVEKRDDILDIIFTLKGLN